LIISRRWTRVLVKAKVIEGNSILLEDKHLLIDYTGQKPYATVLGFAPVLVMRENGFGRTIYALHRTDANAPRFDNRIDWLSLECVDAANHEFKLTSYSISKFTGEGQRNYHYEKVMQGGEDKFDIQPNDLIFIPQGFKKGIPVYIEVVFEPQEVEALPAAALPPFASPQVQALAIVLKAPAPALAQLSPPNEEVLNQKATVMDRFEIIRSQHGYKSLFDMLPEDGKQWVNKHWFKLWLKIDSREGLARKWLLEMTRKNPDWIGQMMDLTEYPWLPSVYREQSGIYKELILSILGLKREFGYPSLFDMLPLERQQTVMKQTMLGNEVYSNHNYKALWELIWMEEKTPGSVRQMLGE